MVVLALEAISRTRWYCHFGASKSKTLSRYHPALDLSDTRVVSETVQEYRSGALGLRTVLTPDLSCENISTIGTAIPPAWQRSQKPAPAQKIKHSE